MFTFGIICIDWKKKACVNEVKALDAYIYKIGSQRLQEYRMLNNKFVH